MITPRSLVALLSFLLSAEPLLAAPLCGRESEDLKKLFAEGTSLNLQGPAPCAILVEIQDGRPDGDSPEAFETRWQEGTGALVLGEDEARIRALYEGRWKPGVKLGRSGRIDRAGALDHDHTGRIDARARRLAEALGKSNEDAGIAGNSSVPRTPGESSGNLSDRDVLAKGLQTLVVPDIDSLHAMGSPTVAPAPTIGMRATSLWNWGASKQVAQDVANTREAAGKLELPPDAQTGLASSEASLGDFVN